MFSVNAAEMSRLKNTRQMEMLNSTKRSGSDWAGLLVIPIEKEDSHPPER